LTRTWPWSSTRSQRPEHSWSRCEDQGKLLWQTTRSAVNRISVLNFTNTPMCSVPAFVQVCGPG
jgi:hypothetical protein